MERNKKSKAFSYDQVKRDYKIIIKELGDPEDMTGGFVDGDYFQKLLMNPSKFTATKMLLDIISFGFQLGEFWNSERKGHISIHDNEIALKMYNKYILYEY